MTRLQLIRFLVPALMLPGYAVSAPLFDSQGVLDVTIEAPISKLSSQRHRKPEFPGTIRYTDASGAERVLAVVVSTRGKSRLDVCNYPPLKISFNPDETAGTVFAGQDNLKLVRQCLHGRTGRNLVYLELGAYRAYNSITDYSFKTRQLNVAYRNTGSSREQIQPGFFLEDDSDVARRMGRERIRPPEVETAQLAPAETTHNLLFQRCRGADAAHARNTDFAVKRGPSGEGCCHNGRVIAEAGQQHDWIVLPYDFDYAGILNASYALPDEHLPIGRVTTRLYRGFCRHNDHLPDSIENCPRASRVVWQVISSSFTKRSTISRNFKREYWTNAVDLPRCRFARARCLQVM